MFKASSFRSVPPPLEVEQNVGIIGRRGVGEVIAGVEDTERVRHLILGHGSPKSRTQCAVGCRRQPGDHRPGVHYGARIRKRGGSNGQQLPANAHPCDRESFSTRDGRGRASTVFLDTRCFLSVGCSRLILGLLFGLIWGFEEL
ncbi:unnamed protein product [Victoria cruziana]